ncbi:MAG: biotin--[acetyl-CoA-carboxylase] ligase [Alkalibacterium sp.]|uniref:biotin--[acetyl-CoA-carboxylase] ligase n=1 Tax=Alkalibacterium sp. TaxID=1872447 RepID=UPI0039710F10
MSLSQKIIDELTLAYPEKISYAQLIKKAETGKESVEQALNELSDQNYPICLNRNEIGLAYPLLSIRAIGEQLNTQFIGRHLHLHPSLKSTNDYAKEHLARLENGDVILAHEQTSGKGRLGRGWSSPAGKSISMSIVLKPTIQFKDISLLTQLTAAALVNALEDWIDVQIKWPNDIILNKKKISGILIETEFSGSILRGIIIGIGVNTNLEKNDIPKELQNKATSIKEYTKKVVDPNLLLARFFTSFERYYRAFLNSQQTDPFLAVCRDHSILLGNDFWIINHKIKRKALIQDIAPSGGLIVKYHDTDQTDIITSTELSIRGDGEYL